MTRREWRHLLAGLTCGLLLMAMAPSYAQADQAQYFYDELGRLIGVVDGQNNAAVYQYDAVGNLLKIERVNTTGGNVGIFLVTPGSAIAKQPDGTPANRSCKMNCVTGYLSPF